ncbi:MAG TPA: GatB/YqeY domain-containing protein [Petrimonas sp.]|uniref:GatB/YqeY domain-containing protein n=1 Tax=Petrimonas sp. TaxID=2023866 RepID=UPI001776BB9F|nr:GatB/YqeY domain-containing protein [Petrimonas sp.]MEA4948462.1 GatB/YqeY domain-containing protein [Petrimonas sp.]MEA4980189.1 GatB/YqeY domain-containing protein [Petrimonas sp.]MEA5045515.1 GatB/YqeY domain-containing protein [Petrimonas sp.]MEA5063592.1 GatB/YqeY domain-containing protein [Petrimonas sp.]
MNLFDTISDEIKKAMLARDKMRLEALRGVKKEFLEAKTAKGASDELSDETATTILQKMVKQRKDSAEIYTTQGRADLAADELAQLRVIQEFLPAQLSSEELESAVQSIIVETGAQSMKDMGKVMGVATRQLAGKAEGRAISEMVKKLLS